MVWRCEVAGDRKLCLEAPIGVELGPVVEGDSLEKVGFCSEDPGECGIRLGCCSMANLCSSCQSRLSFNEGKDAFKVTTTHDRIAFPMTELRPVLGPLRPLRDGAFTFESSSVIYAAVTFSPSFGVDSKMLEDGASFAPVLFDHAVDSWYADGKLSGESEDIADLIGTEVLGQEFFYPVPLRFGELTSPVTGVVSGGGIRVSDEGGIAARGPQVPTKLTINGARMTAEEAGNLDN